MFASKMTSTNGSTGGTLRVATRSAGLKSGVVVAVIALMSAAPALAGGILKVADNGTPIEHADFLVLGEFKPGEPVGAALTLRASGEAIRFDAPGYAIVNPEGVTANDVEVFAPGNAIAAGGFAILNFGFEMPNENVKFELRMLGDADNMPFTVIIKAMAAEVTAPEMQVTDGQVEIANGDTYAMAPANVGQSSSANFTIDNNGDAPLVYIAPKLSVVELTDGNPNDLTAAINLNSQQVPPGLISLVGVSFIPTTPGDRKFELTLHTNDPQTPQFTIVLEVEGIENLTPSMQVSQGQTIIADGDTYDLGELAIDETGSVTFTIENLGGADLVYQGEKVSVEELSTGNPADLTAEFVLNDEAIAPGELSILDVSLIPTTTGPREFEVTIHSNDPETPAFTITILANVVEIEVEPPIGTPIMEVFYGDELLSDGDTHDMGETLVDDTLTSTFTINNLGDAKLSFTGTPKVLLTEMTGGNVADFAVSLVDDEVDPGDSTTLSVVFSPTSLGEREVAMTLESNDAANSPFTILLTAAAIEEVEIDPELSPDMRVFKDTLFIDLGDTVDLGSTAIGQTAGADFVITNVGDLALKLTGDPTVSFRSLGAGDVSEYSATVTATEINPGNLAILLVAFTPTSTGSGMVQVVIESNDPEALEYTFVLTTEAYADCNENGIDDEDDLADGTSDDCNENGTPDECEQDSDNDGVIDDCDECPGENDKLDSDNDKVADCLDNCPTTANADQSDSDGNGVGDACQFDVNPVPPPTDNRFCGAGAAGMLPAMMLGMVGARSRRRRGVCVVK